MEIRLFLLTLGVQSNWGKQKLTPFQQSNRIKRLITSKTLDQLEFPFMLWTRKAAQELIENHYKVKLGLTSISKYLNK
jgi:hypothetical protein